MITTEGKILIKRYLAGQVPTIGRSIGFGIGASAESASSTKLQFEAGRSTVTLVDYDFVSDKLIWKAVVDETFGGSIYEVALYSTDVNAIPTENEAKMLTTFDSDDEEWLDATSGLAAAYTVAGTTRLGLDSLTQTPAASGTKTDALTNLFLDLSGHSASDKFVFAFNVANAFTSSIRFQFHTDATNYYQFALGAQTAGYKIVEAAKSTAAVTGTPNWSNITEIRVSSTSTAGGASGVNFDGMRIDDADTLSQNYVMISREVLATPFTKQEGLVQEIEFSIDVSV